MNIVITDACNRACPYCFAVGAKEKYKKREITMANFVKAVDFFVDSGRQGVSLLGGEPTLHPLFVEFLNYLKIRGLHAHIFSNGIVSKEKIKKIIPVIDQKHTSFLINLNQPSLRNDVESRRVDNFLKTFGTICGIGVNVFRPNYDLTYIKEAFERYNLKPLLRIGISNPSPIGQVECLQLNDYPEALRNIVKLISKVDELGVEISLDCGFPMCLFSDEELGIIFRSSKPGKPTFRCRPVIDIGTDLQAWACYPLSAIGSDSIDNFQNSKTIAEFFLENAKEKFEGNYYGIFKECKECKYRKRRLCSGGCHAHALMHEPVSVEKLSARTHVAQV